MQFTSGVARAWSVSVTGFRQATERSAFNLLWVVVAVLSGSGCSTEPLVTDTPSNKYLLTVRAKINPQIFEQHPGLPTMQPGDEGYLLVFPAATNPPDAWQYSLSQEPSTGGLVALRTVGVLSPLVMSADIVHQFTFAISLPRYICAQLVTLVGHRHDPQDLFATYSTALTSNCTPVPAKLPDMSFEEAMDLLPAPGELVPDPVDVELDTVIFEDMGVGVGPFYAIPGKN